MNRVGVMQFVWQRAKRMPAKVWIAAGFALLLIPALLLWLVFAVVGGAWQVGGALLGQGRAALEQALPAEVAQIARELPQGAALETLQTEAQQRVRAEVERLNAAVPASAEALQQGLAGEAMSPLLGPARPSSDVGGEDPPGIERLPGFVRTAFARDGEAIKVSWEGAAPHAEVVAYYTRQLQAQGYRAQVLSADAAAESVRFESSARQLTLSARNDGRGGSEVDWAVR